MSDPSWAAPDEFAAALSASLDEHADATTERAETNDDRVRIRLRDADWKLRVDVLPADANPTSAAAVERAHAADATAVATCTENDCFLHDGRADPEGPRSDDSSHPAFHYLDLRGRSPDEAARAIVDAVATLAESGRLPDQPERERVVGTLRSFHAAVWPRLESLARTAARRDGRFADRFQAWADEDASPADERFAHAARQYAYLLAAGALHEAIRDGGDDPARGDRPDPSVDVRADSLLADPLDSLVGGLFDSGEVAATGASTAVETTGSEAVDGATAGLFEAFPHDAAVRRAVVELVRTIERRTLSAVDGDLLGGMYEELLTAADRRADGQYYTPPPIAETAVRWAIPGDGSTDGSDDPHVGGPDDVPRVLDPAAGCGTFAVEAYRRLAELHPDRDHQELLDHLAAVDVNRVPLLTTALNLAGQRAGARTETVHASHASFLDLNPGLEPSDRDSGGTDQPVDGWPVDGEPTAAGVAGIADPGERGTVDAVVGNPPFVRQEALDKDHCRRHLAAFEDATVSAKSDAYVYFVTQATRFLREGGRLGFVVPTKWMMTDYGRSFQAFVFDHYRLHAVVGFDARAFDDALVDAALLLLERCSDPRRRAETVTRFVRLDESMPVEDVLDAVTGVPDRPAVDGGDSPATDESAPSATDDPAGPATHDPAGPATTDLGDGRATDERDGRAPSERDGPAADEVIVETRETHRTVALRQSAAAAAESGKLAHYLSAPAVAIRLLRHPGLTRLGDLADVAYGNKTGANSFFFLDAEDLARWPIDDRFLTPAVRSVRGLESRVLTEASTDRYLLDVRSYVEDVGAAGDSADPLAARVKRALARDGHDALRAYVEHGEREGYHDRSTCAAREVWFDLGRLVRPEIVHPKFFDDRIVPLWNHDRLAPSNAVDGLSLHDGVEEMVVLGLLHSTVHEVILECWGRAEGGGALQLMTYEMETLPVVDPAAIQGDRRAALVGATRRLLDGDEAARAAIDDVVLDVLDLDADPAAVRASREALSRRRRRNGDGTAPPVERVDDVGTRSIIVDREVPSNQ